MAHPVHPAHHAGGISRRHVLAWTAGATTAAAAAAVMAACAPDEGPEPDEDESGSGVARLALEMGAVLDLEIGRAGREACSVVLDHAFPFRDPARPAPRPCGDPPTGAARMRMYGSSPRDPEGGWAGLDSVELGSCRIVLDDEGDAEGLLELLGRARRPGGPGVACQRLRSGRPVRLGHGDGGEPDLIVYPDAGEGA